MTFGETIRDLRKANDLTQRELASKVGVSDTYISKIENQRLEHTPSIKTLQKLARALKTDELELMQQASKIPPVLGPILGDENARLFFQRAAAKIKDPQGWADLLEHLESQE